VWHAAGRLRSSMTPRIALWPRVDHLARLELSAQPVDDAPRVDEGVLEKSVFAVAHAQLGHVHNALRSALEMHGSVCIGCEMFRSSRKRSRTMPLDDSTALTKIPPRYHRVLTTSGGIDTKNAPVVNTFGESCE